MHPNKGLSYLKNFRRAWLQGDKRFDYALSILCISFFIIQTCSVTKIPRFIDQIVNCVRNSMSFPKIDNVDSFKG